MKTLLTFLFGVAAVLPGLHGASILTTDFNSATVGNITSNVSSPGIPGTDGMFSLADSTRSLAIADTGGGNNVLQLIDNDAVVASSRPTAYKQFTGGAGSNLITGSYHLRILNTGQPFLLYTFINASGAVQSGTNTAVSFNIRTSTGVLQYYYNNTDSFTVPDTTFKAVINTDYLFSVSLDYSNAIQDKWRLQVATVAAPGVILYDTNTDFPTGVDTRAANVTPGALAWYGGANGAAISASPFAQIDNLNFDMSLVPEPSTAAFLGLGLLGIVIRRTGRR